MCTPLGLTSPASRSSWELTATATRRSSQASSPTSSRRACSTSDTTNTLQRPSACASSAASMCLHVCSPLLTTSKKNAWQPQKWPGKQVYTSPAPCPRTCGTRRGRHRSRLPRADRTRLGRRRGWATGSGYRRGTGAPAWQHTQRARLEKHASRGFRDDARDPALVDERERTLQRLFREDVEQTPQQRVHSCVHTCALVSAQPHVPCRGRTPHLARRWQHPRGARQRWTAQLA